MTNEKKYHTLTDQNFQQEVLESKEPVLVDFWAEWCGPCRSIAPVIEEVAARYEGRLKVGKLEVDTNGETTRRYGVRSIPALLFLKDGQVVDQIIGAAPKGELTKRIDALLG